MLIYAIIKSFNPRISSISLCYHYLKENNTIVWFKYFKYD